MKRAVNLAFILLLVISLAACAGSNPKLKINTVANANLTDREEVILASTADKSFVFDFKVDDKYRELEVWVEKYESGKLSGEINRISTEIKSKGTIIFTASNTIDESDQALLSIAINSDGSTSTGWSPETFPKDDVHAVWGSNSLGDIGISNNMVLASICYSSSAQGISSLSSDFYSDVDGHFNELKNYDVVYLLRSGFRK